MVDSKNKPILEELSVYPPSRGVASKNLETPAELEHGYLVMEVDPEGDSDHG